MINSVQTLRAIFTLIIILHHHNPLKMNAGHIGVEFFFILSGMLLYKTATKKDVSTTDYFVSRWKRLWPAAILTLPLCVVAFWDTVSSIGIWGTIEYLLNDILCIGGIHSVCLNYPMWYVSVLIWGGTFMYGLLKWNRQATMALLIPAVMVYAFTFLDSIHTFGYLTTYNGLPMVLVRGLAEMGEGILLMHFVYVKSDFINSNIKLINILSIITLALTIYIAWQPGLSEIYVVALIPIFLTATFSKDSWLNKILNISPLVWLGGLSYEMFVLHAPIVKLFHLATADVTRYSIPRCIALIAIIIIASVGLKKTAKAIS